ncbi:MAG: hypothetical protein JST80_07405 [Bdellovibrionales bacterium]|nr:hypothetical protein [Bdellovibrionales bacterium]
MIRFYVDALLMLAVSIAAWMRDPFLGVVFLGVSISFAAQYWRTVHLLGWSEQKFERGRVVMAIVLALVFGGGVFPLFNVEVPAPIEVKVSKYWQEDLVPIWIGLGFLSCLALIYLTNERKRR